MARVGRGRSRGGRILDIPILDGTKGRGMTIGRGIAAFPLPNGVVKPKSVEFENAHYGKDTLVEELLEMQTAGDGCFLTLAVNYFSSSNDAEYFMDNVMDTAIKSSQSLMTKFVMSLKLITLLKTHGEKIKNALFKKLQTKFEEMSVHMKDDSSLSPKVKDNLRNFCDLFGQLFYRFRVNLGSPDRYDILSVPTIQCLSHLLRSGTCQDLQVLIRLLLFNNSTLNKLQPRKMMELSLSVRLQLAKDSSDSLVALWRLAALDILNSAGNQLAPELTRFYTDNLGSAWSETVPSSTVELLVAIPFEIAQSHMMKFNVVQNEYNKSRLIDL